MNKLDYLAKKGRISAISDVDRNRYLNFFSKSYRENFEHCKFNLKKFPRWSIISGYYAMHDITKLFLADKFRIKIDLKVHETVIEVFRELIKDGEILKLLNFGYNEFLKLLNDLVEAKEKRTKVQYYTGTAFLKKEYLVQAREFFNEIVQPYLNKIRNLKDVN